MAGARADNACSPLYRGDIGKRRPSLQLCASAKSPLPDVLDTPSAHTAGSPLPPIAAGTASCRPLRRRRCAARFRGASGAMMMMILLGSAYKEVCRRLVGPRAGGIDDAEAVGEPRHHLACKEARPGVLGHREVVADIAPEHQFDPQHRQRRGVAGRPLGGRRRGHPDQPEADHRQRREGGDAVATRCDRWDRRGFAATMRALRLSMIPSVTPGPCSRGLSIDLRGTITKSRGLFARQHRSTSGGSGRSDQLNSQQKLGFRRQLPSALTISSVIFLASPSSIMVLSR